VPGTSASAEHEEVFRGRLTWIVNLIGGAAVTALFVIVFVSTATDPPDSGSAVGGESVAALGILVGIGLIVLSCRASTLVLRRNELVYRSLFQNRHIPRSQIVGIRIEKGGLSRGGGLIKAWIPVLDLAGGSSLWLREMKAGVQGSIDYPDTCNDYTRKMVATLREWAPATLANPSPESV
jgi:hypothetical protein